MEKLLSLQGNINKVTFTQASKRERRMVVRGTMAEKELKWGEEEE